MLKLLKIKIKCVDPAEFGLGFHATPPTNVFLSAFTVTQIF